MGDGEKIEATHRRYVFIGSAVALVLVVAMRVVLYMGFFSPSAQSQYADGMACPSSHAVARVSDLHYPDAKDCSEVEEDVEWSLESSHYKKACREKTGREQVAAARMAECGIAQAIWENENLRGVVVTVELCCGEPLE